MRMSEASVNTQMDLDFFGKVSSSLKDLQNPEHMLLFFSISALIGVASITVRMNTKRLDKKAREKIIALPKDRGDKLSIEVVIEDEGNHTVLSIYFYAIRIVSKLKLILCCFAFAMVLTWVLRLGDLQDSLIWVSSFLLVTFLFTIGSNEYLRRINEDLKKD